MNITHRKQAAILGALVADAASLGFHWIYDADRLAEVAGEHPEFAPPDPRNYEGGVGYFAHANKSSGDATHYGEQMAVSLRSLAKNQGDWKPFDYLAGFRDTFGRGGSFSGYIDGATAGTLDNAKKADAKLSDGAQNAVGALEGHTFGMAMSLARSNGRTLDGEALLEAVMDQARQSISDDKTLDGVAKIVRFYDENRRATIGADDGQIPAFSKLPPIVARYAGDSQLDAIVEQAIRITNDHDEAVQYALFGARALEKVILGHTIGDAMRSASDRASAPVREVLKSALSLDEKRPKQIAEHFGAACNAYQAIPVSVTLLRDQHTFVDGVRSNIFAGGDNAGRSIFVGAMLGAAGGLGGDGVPLSWLARLSDLGDYLAQVESVCT